MIDSCVKFEIRENSGNSRIFGYSEIRESITILLLAV